jgi:hypothetical protein
MQQPASATPAAPTATKRRATATTKAHCSKRAKSATASATLAVVADVIAAPTDGAAASAIADVAASPEDTSAAQPVDQQLTVPAASAAAVPLVHADSQAPTIQRQPSITRQSSRRARSGSQSLSAAVARQRIAELAAAALDDGQMSDADLSFFNELVKLLYPLAVEPDCSHIGSDVAASDAAPPARAASTHSQATQALSQQ